MVHSFGIKLEAKSFKLRQERHDFDSCSQWSQGFMGFIVV